MTAQLHYLPPPPPNKTKQTNKTNKTKQRKLHSTNETIVWRSLGKLEPVYAPCSTSIEFTLPVAVMTQICGVLWSRSFFLRCITADPSPSGNFTPPTKRKCGETLGDLEPVYDLFPVTSELALPEVVTQICMWKLCGACRFSYGESPRTPPLERTSLHRRDTSVERPQGILSLFTTCFRLRMKWPCHRV